MSHDLTIMTMARGLARHSSTRQNLVAENIANADTVGYRARDLPTFAEVYEGPGGVVDAARRLPAFDVFATRPGHTGYEVRKDQSTGLGFLDIREEAWREADSPNGNSVSLEDQMVRGAQSKISHDMALGVMRKAGGLLRMAIGRK